MTTAAKLSSFFKVFLPDRSSERLRIPPKFLKYLEKHFRGNAILIGPSGGQWKVRMTKRENGMYMDHGWPRFLKDNLVKHEEFLVFTYDEKSSFEVQIYDKNGCDFGKGRQFEAATPSMVSTKKAKGTHRPTSADYLHESKPSQEDLALRNPGSLPKNYSSMPQISPEIERSNDCKLAESFTSSSPYFKHIMKKSNVDKTCLLNIATKFARMYLPPAVKEIILQNSLGKHWEVRVDCTCNQDRRYYRFSKGWPIFVRDNKLKIGDTCIFEHVGGNNMRVHMFRCAPS